MPKHIDNKLAKQLRELGKKSKSALKKYREGVIKNAEDACDVMALAAKEHTPHPGDGKPRGFNVITGELSAHWESRFIAADKGSDYLGTVTLTNDMQYASYVQNGHRLTRHFVPWLYVDGMGTISYETNHAQPMFGMVVGTKTKYVKGVDMVGPAIKAFNESFKKMNDDLAKQILDIDDID
jgi:hypothetical protein